MQQKDTRKLIEESIKEYIENTPSAYLREVCRIAEDWHDGQSSAMFKLYLNEGKLEGKNAYRKLVLETVKALNECGLGDPEREKLKKLLEFAMRTSALESHLNKLLCETKQLLEIGMAPSALKRVINCSC